MARFRTTAAFAAALVVGVVLGTWGTPPDAPFLGVREAGALEPFGDCAELGAFLGDTVEEQQRLMDEAFGDVVAVDGFAFDGGAGTGGGAPVAARQAVAESAGVDAGVAAAPAPAEPDGGFSQTNIQEAGVDEPDVVKTDGRRVVAVSGERLHVLTLDGGLRHAGSVSLGGGWGSELLLDGDRVLVLGRGDQPVRALPMPARGPAAGIGRDGIGFGSWPVVGNATLTLVDISDPAGPQVVSSMEMEGEYISARLVDGVARVVLRSYPAAVDAADAEAALPHYRTDGDEAVSILPCEQVLHPPEPAGPGLTTVLSVDLQGPLAPRGAATVVADGHTVYATAQRLYVALSRWDAQPATDIHAFDISDADAARYLGAGTVAGTLLNQWALSTHHGHLRVATTEGDPWAGGSHSAITVLAETGGGLTEVGRVDGLGPDERIYAVRYLGDVGFVVTFRETDPLYTLDLSDPADPRVVGELKIPGFSNYLHPLGDGFLLGVGQDADEQGQRLGVAVSLFDVRDLANPARVQQHTVGEGHTPVEWDHRAFLWWGPASLAVLPVELWNDQFQGAVGLSVGAAGIGETGRVAGPVERNLVVGDALLSYSHQGITVTDLATFAERGRVGF